MPYLPVAHPPQAEVLASAERRWQALVEAKPDLQAAVSLQRGLLTLVIDLARTIDGGRLPRLSLPGKYLAAKLSRGVPVLSGEPIPLPAALLKPALLRFCDELAAGGAGEVATHIGAAIESGRVDAGSLLTASLARDQEAIRTGATHLGLAPDLAWLVAELAVGPVAHALQRTLFATPESGPLARRAGRVESRLLPRVRIVAGAGRDRRRPPPSALRVLRGHVGADDLRVRVLRRAGRGVRHGRAR